MQAHYRPHLTRRQGPSPLSRLLDRAFVVKTRCMLWAAHCLAVAALSAMELRAIEVAKTRQRLQEPTGTGDSSFDATLQQLLHSPHAASPPSTVSSAVISGSHLTRQMLAHLIDFPLAARSAGLQVTCDV